MRLLLELGSGGCCARVRLGFKGIGCRPTARPVLLTVLCPVLLLPPATTQHHTQPPKTPRYNHTCTIPTNPTPHAPPHTHTKNPLAQTNREAIDKITEELLEKETLTGDEMRTILAQYTTIPEENLKAAREQEEAKEAVVA